ncbi:SDR family NAD(P)-dependent oxidoreductase [Paenibacillus sp. FSL P4-0338]|uniref:type I polyketide synthase n=1 Tax=unclassified Paenibacillus TaxID=185978 RepID=UPI0003E1CAD7|nr:type I polyketide synthase [Paenibacillus sp. FSL R7-269]ETT45526.1 beta-ketoacyl synthase family protein,phosphopantetheine-containing protein [Paenibacillus sp. FSL R7-269]
MEELKKYILSQVAKQQLSKDEAKVLLTELMKTTESVQRDVAIIGMAGRFSSANDTEEFWKILRDGVNGIREFPPERLRDIEHVLRNPHYSEFMLGNAIHPEDIPDINVRAGYLDEIDKFDAAFFGIPRTEATYMDPNQRVALEIAWEAMEDAGYGGDSLIGSRTGVYIGRDETNYSFYRLSSDKHPMQLTGSWESMIVSRISYAFDFKGPSMIIDTACSAGLVSIHMAAQALIAGECHQAIAGGLNLTTTGEIKPRYLEGANMENVESNDELVKTFDAKANGTVWGEGAGVVLLKPLHRALEDGDHIRGIIKASAINNDGRTNSLTAPSAKTQEDVIVDAWEKAGIPPETISYVEAHGTGTVLGDPIEVKGLMSAFRRYTSRRQFCGIGSLKSNMGHMVAASGVASLIKVIKSMEHKELPPTINFYTPNPYINFVESPFYVNNKLQSWDVNGIPRRAAISSFGFSRTNCHLVVEEAPNMEPKPALQPRYCLSISAKNEEVMQQYLQRYMPFLEGDSWNLADLCYTSNIGRGHYEYRTVIIAGTENELREKVKALVNNGGSPLGLTGVYTGYHMIVSEKKQLLESGELSVYTRNNLSELASFKMKDYLNGDSSDASILERVCRHYVEGADINWELLYHKESRRRIPIPVYPLQRIRVWADPKVSKIRTKPADNLHPLVEEKLPAHEGKHSYQTTFRIDKHWVLSDHRISNKAVLPGTSYLEMVRFAAARAFGQESIEFRDVFFLFPLIVEEEAEVLAQLTLTPRESGYSFSVASCNQAGEWISHLEGKVYALDVELGQDRMDLTDLKSRADEVQDPFIDDHDTGVFRFGPHWDTVRAVWRIGSETLARLQLAENLQQELNIYPLHPSLLDNAVNLTSQSTGETFLPFMYKRLRFYRSFTQELYTHIRLHTAKDGRGETMTYDIDIVDAEGRIAAQISDYSVKRVHDLDLIGSDDTAGSCLQMTWVAREESKKSLYEEKDGPWALIATEGSRYQGLRNALEVAGVEVVTFLLAADNKEEAAPAYTPDPKGMDTILSIAEKNGVKGLLFSCDYTLEAGESDLGFAERRSLGVDALFQLCKSILNGKSKWPGGLKVLVRDAWAVDHSEWIVPLSAATGALGRVIGQEYKHLNVDIVDVSGPVSEIAVVDELFRFKGAGLRALRTSGVFIEELRPHRVPLNTSLSMERTGVYLISGGLGGVGLAVAGRLAEKGKANVVLLGRTPIAPADEWKSLSESGPSERTALYCKLIDLKSRLGSLEYISLDVSNRDSVRVLGDSLQDRYGEIAGIFHAAGVAGDGFLMSKDKEQFSQVLNPKLDGTMNLMHLLLPQEGKGFLALFSSITALTGGEGQGDYSAANAFLDSFAESASRQRGLKVISVNWPSWKEVGMSVDFSIDAADNLFSHLDVEDGLNWLEYLIVHPKQRIVPAALNTRLAAQLADDLPFRLAPEISIPLAASDKGSGQSQSEASVKLKGVVEITDTQRTLGNIFAAVLGLSEIDVFASFQDMGGNSLMSTQLLKLLEDQFPGLVDISDIFSYPSVNDMSDFIDSQRQHTVPDESLTAGQSDDVVDELMELLERELSGTEFLEFFLDKSTGGGQRGEG